MSENAWIEWSGGRCPVGSDVIVDVRLRDNMSLIGDAGRFDWHHGGRRWGLSSDSGDIIAYRLSGPSA